MSDTIHRFFEWWFLFGMALAGGILSATLLINVDPEPRKTRSPGNDAAPIEWKGEALKAVVGSSSIAEGQFQLQLDAAGQGVVELPVSNLIAKSYRFLVLDVTGLRYLEDAALVWQVQLPASPVFKERGAHLGPMRYAALPLNGWSASWLDLSRQSDWSGNVAKLGLVMQGKPGLQVSIRHAALAPDSKRNWVAWVLARWAHHDPWSQQSINFFEGVGLDPPIAFRVPIIVAFLGGGVLTYFLILAFWRFRLAFDWHLVATLMLIAWIALDAPWQWQLWLNLADTYTVFAGKSAHEKALADLDGPVYQLTEQLRPFLGEQPARVFIASPDEYLGLRAAYRLYPHNPYWARNRQHELPLASQLQPGDFVLTLQSIEVKFEPVMSELRWQDDQRIAVERLYADQLGQLYRVL